MESVNAGKALIRNKRKERGILIPEKLARALRSCCAEKGLPLESREARQKRKIVWDVHKLANDERRPTPNRVILKACISTKYLAELTPFIMEQLSKL